LWIKIPAELIEVDSGSAIHIGTSDVHTGFYNLPDGRVKVGLYKQTVACIGDDKDIINKVAIKALRVGPNNIESIRRVCFFTPSSILAFIPLLSNRTSTVTPRSGFGFTMRTCYRSSVSTKASRQFMNDPCSFQNIAKLGILRNT
jgi:hypothetical protein